MPPSNPSTLSDHILNIFWYVLREPKISYNFPICLLHFNSIPIIRTKDYLPLEKVLPNQSLFLTQASQPLLNCPFLQRNEDGGACVIVPKRSFLYAQFLILPWLINTLTVSYSLSNLNMELTNAVDVQRHKLSRQTGFIHPLQKW